METLKEANERNLAEYAARLLARAALKERNAQTIFDHYIKEAHNVASR